MIKISLKNTHKNQQQSMMNGEGRVVSYKKNHNKKENLNLNKNNNSILEKQHNKINKNQSQAHHFILIVSQLEKKLK